MISNVVGAVLGLLVGGQLNRHGDPNGFRTYFYISIGLFALTAIICVFTYHPLPTKSQTVFTLNEKLARLDWIGYGLEACSIVLFSLGLFWSKNPFQWSDPHVAATFSIGVALGLVLVVYETKFKKDGMFHHGLFSNNRNFTIAIVCVFCEGVAFFAANVYFSFEVCIKRPSQGQDLWLRRF
jgi:MFS family permease